MLLGLFSDVHNNVRDLERVLAYFQSRSVDAYLQLGDLGVEPLRLLDGLPVRHVFGNWEVSGLPSHPNGRWLDIATWPAHLIGPGWIASHATPAFPSACNTTATTQQYMRLHQPRWMQLFPSLLHDASAVWSALAEMEVGDRRVAFHGHTHVQAVQQLGHDNNLRRLQTPLIDLPPGTRTLVGIGSVGVPRDGPHPACTLFDAEAWQVELITLAGNTPSRQSSSQSKSQ